MSQQVAGVIVTLVASSGREDARIPNSTWEDGVSLAAVALRVAGSGLVTVATLRDVIRS